MCSSDLPKKIASEWVCVEHAGYAREKAIKWWATNVGTRTPDTVAEAVERLRAGEMRRVLKIRTRPDGDYTRVIGLLLAEGRQPGEDDEPILTSDNPILPSVDPWDGDDLPF